MLAIIIIRMFFLFTTSTFTFYFYAIFSTIFHTPDLSTAALPISFSTSYIDSTSSRTHLIFGLCTVFQKRIPPLTILSANCHFLGSFLPVISLLHQVSRKIRRRTLKALRFFLVFYFLFFC